MGAPGGRSGAADHTAGIGRSGKGLAIVRAAALTGTIRRASDHTAGALGSERLLPVLPELRALLPGRGLRRGATVAVATTATDPSADGGPTRPARSAGARSTGATSLLLALLSAASGAGSWCAVVGVPTLGAVAAAEAGIALDRLALVPHPGPDWTTVVAALLDGVDIVVAAPPGPITPSTANRLAARARQRGSVLVSYGRWDGADITFDAVRGVWHGLGQGHGRLRCRQLTIMARGRGSAAAPKRTEVWWPQVSGPLAGHLERTLGRTPPAAAGRARDVLRATG
ncbi:hypothetical protein ACNTMW_12260 [Planosporangium sp. 12N6]|uniref:hypothetical protein n=1 Tax=Planosporangium spinosum TaxID=3402278 RepID=UPI003CEF0231